MNDHFFFWVGMSFVLVHEMDAIKQQEWAIFPLISGLKEKIGYYVFVALHIPLYWVLFWNLYRDDGLNLSLVKGLDIFFVVHVLLHVLFLKHPKNQFTSLFSWVIIIGGGLAGVLDLALGF